MGSWLIEVEFEAVVELSWSMVELIWSVVELIWSMVELIWSMVVSGFEVSGAVVDSGAVSVSISLKPIN